MSNDPYAKAGLFKTTFVSQLAELDVTGQHLDRQWEKFQLEGKLRSVCVFSGVSGSGCMCESRATPRADGHACMLAI